MTDKFDHDAILVLLDRVYRERRQQYERWGQQDHEFVHAEPEFRRFARQADRWKQINDARSDDGSTAWDGILLEEVYEALSETDPHLRVEELIQVAAVALAEAEAIGRFVEATAFDGVEEEAA